MASHSVKKRRQAQLMKILDENPFLTDEELAEIFCVSVPTIRFDRAELGVKEYRERVKSMARTAIRREGNMQAVSCEGELLDLTLYQDAVAVLTPDESMTFSESKIIRGCYIYSFAETLATRLIGANVALVEVANIKYKNPVTVHSKLVARAQVVRSRNNEYTVWVKIKLNQSEVFRSKFILAVID